MEMSRGQTRRILNDALLSNVTAVIRYVASQYDSGVITLIGVGAGGGLALESAAEFSTLSVCMNLYKGLPVDGIDYPPLKNVISSPENVDLLSNEQKESIQQVGAGVILGTKGLEAELENDLLTETDLNADDIDTFLNRDDEDDNVEMLSADDESKIKIVDRSAKCENRIVDTGKGSILNPEPGRVTNRFYSTFMFRPIFFSLSSHISDCCYLLI